MPFIFSGLKVAVTLAVIGEIVAEFVSGNTGLGYLILVANSDLNVAMSFAAIVLLSVMGFALFAAVELLEKIVIPWNAGQEEPGISRF
jgi:NitT/TauT family transport system permease protein